MSEIKLTQYSHGAGCGCKISPEVLGKILHTNEAFPDFKNLIVGNNTRDDAAVLDLGNGTALISTTDFFMPIVDDAFDFGRIASVNAISDVYAMGGTPVLAIAILGWPIDKLSPDIAAKVIEGSRKICAEAGIPLAGGHSIDSLEPIFGLAVNGIVPTGQIKTNSNAKPGNVLFLTKPLGIGIYTTAEKKGLLKPEHKILAIDNMTKLNKIGAALGGMKEVSSMTDVTGFGLAGHLKEMCEGSGVHAEIYFNKIPFLQGITYYIDKKCIPGGTIRNWKSYGDSFDEITDFQRTILADPQTSGGLLIAVEKEGIGAMKKVLKDNGYEWFMEPVGAITEMNEGKVIVVR